MWLFLTSKLAALLQRLVGGTHSERVREESPASSSGTITQTHITYTPQELLRLREDTLKVQNMSFRSMELSLMSLFLKGASNDGSYLTGTATCSNSCGIPFQDAARRTD